jgi:hypothetical protein
MDIMIDQYKDTSYKHADHLIFDYYDGISLIYIICGALGIFTLIYCLSSLKRRKIIMEKERDNEIIKKK